MGWLLSYWLTYWKYKMWVYIEVPSCSSISFYVPPTSHIHFSIFYFQTLKRVYVQSITRFPAHILPPNPVIPSAAPPIQAELHPLLAPAWDMKTLLDTLLAVEVVESVNQRVKFDDDIEIGDEVVSFSCPLSLSKIIHPGKGIKCKHAQCFDVEVCYDIE